MQVAIVHDWLNQYGGAERVLEALHALYPAAPVYAAMYGPQVMPPAYRSWDIRPSFMQRLPGVIGHHQVYLLLYPRAVESYDLSAYDLVISTSSSFAHAAIAAPHAPHVCYCHNPMRFGWNYDEYVRHERVPVLARGLLQPFIRWLRSWDRRTAARVDDWIANSRNVAGRIRQYYGRESVVIPPPVDVSRFHLAGPGAGDYYLILSRLIPYKRIDVAVQAFAGLDRPLWIAGSGRALAELEAIAPPNVRFLGRVPDEDVPGLYAGCRAFIFPGQEDLGITPLEAMAAGRPVIAYAAGGALETVIEGETGVFFREQTPEALAAAIREFEAQEFDPAAARRQAERFDINSFQAQISALVDQCLERGVRRPLHTP
ncbi:MAG: glycosyltransferase [Chloroflexi bacterium]|nr:glycosyltransferase [Chloroflexota bacterium]